jgi:hypothetical protein
VAKEGQVMRHLDPIRHSLRKGFQPRTFVTQKAQPLLSFSTVPGTFNSQEGVMDYRTELRRPLSQSSLSQNQDRKKKSRRHGNGS